MFKGKRLFLDLETTGVEKLIHGVYQIAGLIEINNKVIDEFNFRCNLTPNRDIDPEALLINKITEVQIKSYPRPEIVCKQLTEILEDYNEEFYSDTKFTIVGYNTSFDIDFIKRWFDDLGYSRFHMLQDWQPVCVLSMARILRDLGDKLLVKAPNMKLVTLCRLLEIPHNPHDALSDIKATRILRQKLIRRLLKQQG